MDLIKHLRIATPLVWVRTDEPERVGDVVVANARRKVFRIDPFDGLVVWKDDDWKKVIIEVEEDGVEIERTTKEPEEALMYVLEEKGTMIMNYAHSVVKDMIPFFGSVYGKYRLALFNNDLDDCPAQFVFLSHEGEVPPEIATHAAFINQPMPSNEDLAHLVAKVGINLPEGVEVDLQGTVQAGIGLNENQFMQAVLTSLAELGKIDSNFVSKWKLDMIKQGGVLEIRRPIISLDDIGGLDNAKEIIKDAVWIWENPEQAQEFMLEPIRRMLLIGVPGTGKSAICEATAKTLNLDLAKTGISQSMNKFIGQSESNMRSAFAQIGAMAPLVVWMDELGRDLSSGDYEGDSGTTSRVHGEFLTGLQELPENVFLMAAANSIDRVAPEMLRADRFDKIMFVGMPTASEREAIFGIHLGEHAPEHDLTRLAEASHTFTGAEIKSLIKEVRTRISPAEKRHINSDDIINFIPEVRNRLWIKDPELIKNMYRRALDEYDWASTDQRDEAELYLGNKLQPSSTAGNKQFTAFGA